MRNQSFDNPLLSATCKILLHNHGLKKFHHQIQSSPILLPQDLLQFDQHILENGLKSLIFHVLHRKLCFVPNLTSKHLLINVSKHIHIFLRHGHNFHSYQYAFRFHTNQNDNIFLLFYRLSYNSKHLPWQPKLHHNGNPFRHLFQKYPALLLNKQLPVHKLYLFRFQEENFPNWYVL